MCGIVGIWSKDRSFESLMNDIKKATDTILHRGPDGVGLWGEKEEGIVLGHRRLSIIDLTSQGHQPMISSSGRYVITFNGEIYNYIQLRTELSVSSWKGTSDTETLLEAIENWGIKKTLEKLQGMFAFSVFDQKNKSIFLARDRMGEKPLYYGFKEKNFFFASELKPILTIGNSPFKLNYQALASYLKYSYIPHHQSILEGIYKLLPGHFIELDYQNFQNQSLSDSEAYWQLPAVQARDASFEENKEELEKNIKSGSSTANDS